MYTQKKSDDRTIQSLYLKTISTIEVTSDRGLFQCEVTHTIFKMKNPAKNTCTITYAGYDMLHIRCINSNSWECNFQRSKNLKRSPPGFKFKLYDRWAWIDNHFNESNNFVQIVYLTPEILNSTFKIVCMIIGIVLRTSNWSSIRSYTLFSRSNA